MAGAGYKLFNSGDVLTAAQVNTYLMEQTVMVFDDAAARTTALSGVVSEGMISYLKDTNAVEVYNGSSWVASDDPNAIQNTIVDAKGDLITATAADTPARLASSGVNGNVLTVDTSTATGLKWAAPAGGGGLTLITSTTISNATSKSIDNCFTSTYDNYLINVVSTGGASDTNTLTLRLRTSGSDSSSSYDYQRLYATASTVSTDGNVVGTDEFLIGNNDKDNICGFNVTLFSPEKTTFTGFWVMGSGFYSNTKEVLLVSGNHGTATSYDGFTILGNSNLTGTIRVYGYQNS